MTRQYKLGQIETVDLRDVWPHEALDFTKWLSENENLEILSEAVGIELELVETESSVGSFNVDIFADEVGTGRKVIIENQLEETNHDHLGIRQSTSVGMRACSSSRRGRVVQSRCQT